jgi:helix-turn-helix protein
VTLAAPPPGPTGPTGPDDLLRAAALIRAAAAGLRRDARRAQLRAGGRRGDVRPGLHGGPPNDAAFSGDDLRRAREQAGLSQRELAQQLPYGRGLIADVEGGRRSAPHGLAVWARQTLAASEKGGAA